MTTVRPFHTDTVTIPSGSDVSPAIKFADYAAASFASATTMDGNVSIEVSMDGSNWSPLKQSSDDADVAAITTPQANAVHPIHDDLYKNFQFRFKSSTNETADRVITYYLVG